MSSKKKSSVNSKSKPAPKPKGKGKKRWTLDVGPSTFGPVNLGKVHIDSKSRSIARNNGNAAAGLMEVVTNQAPMVKKSQVVSLHEVLTPNGVFSDTPSYHIAFSASIQPGDDSVFPFLAQIARLYETYEFVSLALVWKPMITFVGAPQGRVILTTNYDVLEAAPGTQRIAESQDPVAFGMPSENIVLKLDPARLNRGGKFVRWGPPIAGSDLKTYDAGRFFCAISGVQSGEGQPPLGELWVEYTVRLHNPRLLNPASSNLPTNRNRTQYLGGTSFAGSQTEAVVFSGSTSPEFPSDCGITMVQRNIGTALVPINVWGFQLPNGYYTVTIQAWVKYSLPAGVSASVGIVPSSATAGLTDRVVEGIFAPTGTCGATDYTLTMVKALALEETGISYPDIPNWMVISVGQTNFNPALTVTVECRVLFEC